MNLLSALARSRIDRPASLGVRELRAIWELRMARLDLRPGVDAEEDFALFCEDYQHPGLVWTLWEGERVVGTYLQRIMPMEHAGRRILVLAPDYVFLAKHLRGHMILPLAVTWLTLRPLLRHPTRWACATGGVYPAAYIPWRRMLGEAWSLGDSVLSPQQAALVAATGARIWGSRWRGDGRIDFRTMPIEREPTSSEGRALLAAYERLNPDWRDGVALYFVTPLTLRTVTRGVRHALRLQPRRAAPSPVGATPRG